MNQITVSVILDTGASASLIPQNGIILTKTPHTIRPRSSEAKTANNQRIQFNSITTLEIAPARCENLKSEAEFLILPGTNNILGYQAIVGLDLIKKLDIMVFKENEIMCAYIDSLLIGSESVAGQMKSVLGLTSSLELSDNLKIGKELSIIDRLLENYQDVFAESISTTMKIEPMRIDLTSPSLVKAKLRKHSPEDISEIRNQIDMLLKNEIIEPSISPYSSNAHLVPKKNGQQRLVINFIPLNAITRKDHYPMPQIEDLFGAIRDAKHFSALDCTEGFFQIPLLKTHRDRTAFITPQGMFQFKRCPFGFTNSPACFQRAMNTIFKEGIYKRCVIYIDDILVFGQTEAEMISNLVWVLNKSREFNIKLKRTKCKFLQTEVEFLGYLIKHNSIAPVPGKCDPILINQPTCKTDVLAILGTFNYYARFIEQYSEKTKILRALSKKDTPFVWTEAHRAAVSALREDLSKTQAHKIPETYSPKFIDVFIGSASVEVTCLTNEQELISRAGLTLSSSEINYTVVEKHLIALILAYRKFGPYLRGPVTVRTTCRELKTAISAKERTERVNRLLLKLPPESDFSVMVLPSIIEVENSLRSENPPDEVYYTDGACMSNGKPECRASWAYLATKHPELSSSGMVNHPRPSNQVAEVTALIEACKSAKQQGFTDIIIITDSKYAANAVNKWLQTWKINGWKDHKGKPVVNEELMKELAEAKSGLELKCLHVRGHADDAYNIQVDNMARNLLEQTITACLTILETPSLDQTQDAEATRIISELATNQELAEIYELIDGKLYFVDAKLPAINRNRLFVPKRDRKLLIKLAHDDPIYGGHLGIKKTRAKLLKYYWPHMRADIEYHITTCNECQHFKTPRGPRTGLMQSIPISKIFERLHIDIVGPLKESISGKRYIVTAIDAFSRFGYAKAYKEVKSDDILSFLQQEVISKHGVPHQITSDNGAQFTSGIFEDYLRKLGIKHARTCAYHPQSNGLDERFNGTLVKILRNYISADQLNWDEKLIWALMLYNTTPNDSTSLSPYSILYGVEPRTPLNTIAITQDSTNKDSEHEIVRAVARDNSNQAHQVQKYYYDKHRQEQTFKPFDLVLTRAHTVNLGDSRKLAYKWVGPYIITRIITHDNYSRAIEVLDLRKATVKRIAFQDAKIYRERENEDEEVENEEIIGKLQEAQLLGDIILENQKQIYSSNRDRSSDYNSFGCDPIIMPTHTYNRDTALNTPQNQSRGREPPLQNIRTATERRHLLAAGQSRSSLQDVEAPAHGNIETNKIASRSSSSMQDDEILFQRKDLIDSDIEESNSSEILEETHGLNDQNLSNLMSRDPDVTGTDHTTTINAMQRATVDVTSEKDLEPISPKPNDQMHEITFSSPNQTAKRGPRAQEFHRRLSSTPRCARLDNNDRKTTNAPDSPVDTTSSVGPIRKRCEEKTSRRYSP